MPRTLAQRAKRTTITLAITAGVCVLLYAGLDRWLHHSVRERIAKAAHELGAEWSAPERSVVKLDLWGRAVRVRDLQWTPLASRDSAKLAVDGHIDSLSIDGIGIAALILGKGIHVGSIVLDVEHLNVALAADTVDEPKDEPSSFAFSCGSFTVRSGAISITTPGRAVVRSDHNMIAGREVAYERDGDGVSTSGYTELDVLLTGVHCTPFADSALVVDTVVLSGTRQALRIAGIRFGVSDVMRTAKTLSHERDVIAGKVDAITLTGIDLQPFVEGKPGCSAIRIGRSQLEVARDKVLRDQAFIHKALPARLVRLLPLEAGVDSILLDPMNVVYYERVDAARGFARIPFDSITAVVTGLRHTNTDTIDLRATAFTMGRTPVSLLLRAAVADSADQMQVDASVGAMAFATLNPVLTPLTGIATPEGRLDTLILRMKGGDRRATARCWMRYDGLKLNRKMDKNKALDPLLNGLMNAVVKRDRTGEKDGDGWISYAWERRRDRALFNYLWSGVREGAKASMLPEAVLKQTGSR